MRKHQNRHAHRRLIKKMRQASRFALPFRGRKFIEIRISGDGMDAEKFKKDFYRLRDSYRAMVDVKNDDAACK